MESLKGSSFTGQGYEEVVVRAMQRMGFTVLSNNLLDNRTGEFASAELKDQWVRYILAKEFKTGNKDPWRQLYQYDPSFWELSTLLQWRPYVTEVDVMAGIPSPAQVKDIHCGFSIRGFQLTIGQFIGMMGDRNWLIEISGPSGASARKHDKATQLQWLQHLADLRNCGEGVALFYNGVESSAPAPVTFFHGWERIVMMHFLPSMLWDLPEKIVRKEKEQEAQAALQQKEQEAQAALQQKEQEAQAALQQKEQEAQAAHQQKEQEAQAALQRLEAQAALQERRLTMAMVAIATLAVFLTASLARKGRII